MNTSTATVTIVRTTDTVAPKLVYAITITKSDGSTLTANRPSYELALEFISLQMREEGWK